MNEIRPPDAYGVLTEPTTLTIQRLLPGPIERVWAYLTDGELRGKWLADGDMELKAGAPFTFVWRNGTLSDVPSDRPEGFSEEHRMESRIVACEPPRKLVFTWNGSDDVSFELAPAGARVLLTVTHRRLPTRDMLLKVAAGWHQHLDTLAAAVSGTARPAFWEGWVALKDDYDRRLPG
jgi:uncharacterized protein YndB with AHSA1/START domain